MADQMVIVHNSCMGRKKMTATEEEKATDRHKPGSFLVRLPGAYAAPLDALVKDNPGSDRTEWVRIAIKHYLESRGVWPSRE
jgi:hypothetical protein